MPEKFCYTFLLIFGFFFLGMLLAPKGSQNETFMNNGAEIFLVATIISAICWIWS